MVLLAHPSLSLPGADDSGDTAGVDITDTVGIYYLTDSALPPRQKPVPEEDTQEDDGLELPVSPDEGAPLIPDDDERVINVPS